MKVRMVHEFQLDLTVEHGKGEVLVEATEVDGGGLFHYPREIFEPEEFRTFTPAEVAGLSDREIIDKAIREVMGMGPQE